MAGTRYKQGGWWEKDLMAYQYRESDRPDPSYWFLREKLDQALAETVTPRQRQVMELYYGCGLSMEKVAARLGVDRSTVSRTLKRGEARLQRCLRYSRPGLTDRDSLDGLRRKGARNRH